MDDKGTSDLILYYGEFQSAILGQLFIAASDKGGYSIQFDEDSAAFITHLAEQIPEDRTISIMHNPAKTAPFCAALEAYFETKTPIPLDLPMDLGEMTGFQQEILNHIRQIPFGATSTYGDIAEAIGNPNASRAIGQVLRRNPLPIFIPCHRVLNADGTLGGYGGVMGSERKISLLKHEGIIFA